MASGHRFRRIAQAVESVLSRHRLGLSAALPHVRVESLEERRLLATVTSAAADLSGFTQGLNYSFDTFVGNADVLGALTLADLARATTIARDQMAVNSTGTNAVRVTWPGHTGVLSGVLQDGHYEALLEDGGGSAFTVPSSLFLSVYQGDLNGDTDVGFDDLLIVAQNYGLTGKTYAEGNANYDPAGNVDFDDLLIIAQKYGTKLTPIPDATNTLAVGSATSSSMTLNFTPPIDLDTGLISTLFTGFRVFRSSDGTNFTQVSSDADPDLLEDGGTIYTWTDSTLQDGTKYWYRVRPYNTDSGNGAPTGNWHTTNKEWAVTTLPMPLSLAATAPNGTTVNLTWQDQSANENRFVIQRATDAAFTANLETFNAGPGGGQRTYQDTTVSPGVTYYYRVRAANSVQYSAFTTGVSVTPAATSMAPPANLTAVGVGDGRVELSWSDHSTSETGFRIQRATNAAFSVGLTNIDLAANATLHSDSGLAAGTTYYYRVIARGSPDSAASNVAIAATLASGSAGLTIAPALDGDTRADLLGGSAFGADGGNPTQWSYSGGAVRLSDGREFHSVTDLVPGEAGAVSGHTRTWSSDPVVRSVNIGQGEGWVVSQIPVLSQRDADTIAVVDGGRSVRWFDFVGGVWKARHYSMDRLEPADNQRLRLTDSSGNVTEFYDFTNAIVARRGMPIRFIDAGGNETVYTPESGTGRIETIERKRGSGTVLELLEYTYDAVTGLLSGVAMSRLNDYLATPALEAVRQVAYTYYNGTQRLKQAIVKSGSTEIERSHYRYDVDGRLTHILEGASFERAANDPAIVDPTDIAKNIDAYADLILTWNLDGTVASQTIQGLGTYAYEYSTSGVHPNAYNNWKYKTIEYLPDATPGTLTDNDRQVVYSNFAGEVVARIFVDERGANDLEWVSGYRYDDAGRLLSVVHPSATNGSLAEANADILAPVLRASEGRVEVNAYYTSGVSAGYLASVGVRRGNSGGGTVHKQSEFAYGQQRPYSNGRLVTSEITYRNDNNSGAITTTHAYDAFHADAVASLTTTLPAVGVDQNGANTNATEVQLFDAFGRLVRFTDGDTKVTAFGYHDSTGTLRQTIVDVGGLNLTSSVVSDLLRRPVSETDPNGATTTMQYVDGARQSRITVLPPLTPSANPVPGGASVPTLPAQITLIDRGTGTIEELRVSRSEAGAVLSGITGLHRSFFNAQWQLVAEERYDGTSSMSYSSAGAGSVSGSGTRYRTEYGYDARGRQDRVAAGRDYYISGSILTTNPTITRTVFDALDRPVATWIGTDDTGWTQASTSHTNLVQVSASEYDDNGIGDSNLTKQTQFVDGTSGNNRVTRFAYDWRDRWILSKAGVQVSEASDVNRPLTYIKYDNLGRAVMTYVFDGDGLSDGSLTTDANSDGVPDMPVSGRMRSASLTQYDSRGQVYRTAVFNVSQGTGTDTSGGPSVAAVATNDAAAFAALSDTGIANLQGLRTNFWFDNRGNTIKAQQPGGLVNKVAYDGASRPLIHYTTDGGGDSGHSDAANVTGDIVLEQVETQYDQNGNVVLTIHKQRHHNETVTGALMNGATSPRARVSYVGYWYDEGNRLATTVDWGNNGGTAPTRPSDPGTRNGIVLPVPNADGFDPYLRSDVIYDDAGRIEYQLSPRQWEVSAGNYQDIKTRTGYDSLDRPVQVWEAYEDGTPGLDNDRGKLTEYNGFDQVIRTETRSFLTAGSRNYISHYIYGVEKGVNGNEINHSGLLDHSVLGRPVGAPSGTHVHGEIVGSYSRLGEQGNRLEVVGAVDVNRQFISPATIRQTQQVFNLLGQQVSTIWAQGPSIGAQSMEDRGRKLTTAYDTLGRGILFSTRQANDTVVNQVRFDFDGLGNLTADWQEHNGTVGGGTKKVSYTYDTSYADNRSRLSGTVYPNGRVVTRVYGHRDFTSSDSLTTTLRTLNDKISRVGFIMDETSTGSTGNNNRLEGYSYLGLDTVVIRDYPRSLNASGNPAGDYQSYVIDLFDHLLTPANVPDDAGADDPYGGLDRFGRPIIHDWGHEIRVYAYDAEGHVLSSWNPVTSFSETWRSELFSGDNVNATNAYDKLGRIQTYQRGRMVPTAWPNDTRPREIENLGVPTDDDDVPIPTYVHNWQIDAGGNYDRNGYMNTPAERKVFQRDMPTYNSPAQPAPLDERIDAFVQFDGFGRMATKSSAKLIDLGGDVYKYDIANTLQTLSFDFDALGRRIIETDSTGDTTDHNGTMHIYFDASGNVIEEIPEVANALFPIPDFQYVWSVGVPGMLVARDSEEQGDAPNNRVGDYGFPGSGLDQRVWAYQGPDGSTWRVKEDHTNFGDRAFEQFTYSAEGVVTISGYTSSDWLIRQDSEGRPRSQFNWRYLWQGGRDDGDGLLRMPDGNEHDTHAGNPLLEDAFAYTTFVTNGFFDSEHNAWTAVQERTADAGTQGQWSYPEPYYDPKTDSAYSSMFPKWYLDATEKALPYAQLLLATGSFVPGPIGWASLGGSTVLGGLSTWSEGGTTADVLKGAAVDLALLGGLSKGGKLVKFAYATPTRAAVATAAVMLATPSVAEASRLTAISKAANVLLKTEKAAPKLVNLHVPSAAKGRSYITYVLRNAKGDISYVGRASGKGSPLQVLERRLSKGHDHFIPGRTLPDVLSAHTSRSAMRGAEHFYWNQFRSNLTNKIAPIDFTRLDRAEKGLKHLRRFLNER